MPEMNRQRRTTATFARLLNAEGILEIADNNMLKTTNPQVTNMFSTWFPPFHCKIFPTFFLVFKQF